MSIRIKGIRGVNKNIDKLQDKTKEGMREVMSAVMAEAEASAKKNAPWTDRTANARNSITGQISKETDTSVEGVLSIGMEYGKYLELRYNGKYRIIQPTVDWSITRFPIWAKSLIK